MGEDWKQDPHYGSYGSSQPNGSGQPNQAGQPNQDEIDKRIEDIKRAVSQGANEAQLRFKRVVDRASEYWQQAQTTPSPPRQSDSIEEQRIRQLVNVWSNENWRVARELGTYMGEVSWTTDEVWEAVVETRWETRTMEVATEPYTGKSVGTPQPLLPVWDYELPPVVGLKAPQTRTRVDGLDEIVSCTGCNGTGRVLCANCSGRGWVVCPDCKGRMKNRCSTCRGRGYVADWTPGEKKPFFQKQAENVATSLSGKVADVFDNIRQQGVPIPNPVDTDPANKGRTVPCPDCVNGEVDCSCGNGKRVCTNCQGAKMSFCSSCSGTGKLVRHRDIVRQFDLRTQNRLVGDCPIPQQQLLKASGDLAYNAEVNETLHPDAPPEGVPTDIWRETVELVQTENRSDLQANARATLQVIELVHIPYTKVQYRYANQDYTLYIYDSEGKEKFYAERYPARWDRIERLVKAISTDLMGPTQKSEATPTSPPTTGGYRVPIEVPPYNITEEDGEDTPGKR